MESILLTGKKKSDLKLLLELAKKIGIKSRPISKEELEDWSLAKVIIKGLKTSNVPRSSIMKALNKK